MFDGEAGLVRGYRLVGVAYAVFMALEVFLIESVLDAANTVGVVGIAGFIPAALPSVPSGCFDSGRLCGRPLARGGS